MDQPYHNEILIIPRDELFVPRGVGHDAREEGVEAGWESQSERERQTKNTEKEKGRREMQKINSKKFARGQKGANRPCEMAGGSKAVDAARDRFPHCVVWTPLPIIRSGAEGRGEREDEEKRVRVRERESVCVCVWVGG
jgi:hypothetical protein